jgi:hypothetical protein
MMRTLHKLRRSESVSLLGAALLVGVVSVTGIAFIVMTHAAGISQAFEAESATLSGVTQVSDQAAAGGAAIKFGVGTTGSGVKPRIVGHQLQLGTTGTRLKMDGVAVWGLSDGRTDSQGGGTQGSGAVAQYNNRQAVVNTIKAWGGNHVRMRLLGSYYNGLSASGKAQLMQQVKDWRDVTVASGMYFQPTWWDSLDDGNNGCNWPSQYSNSFAEMRDVVSALGNDPMVYYEPFNEPTGCSAVTWSAWLGAFKDTLQTFRGAGYTGILLCDGIGWSHGYNDSSMTQLEQYDAGLAGMGGVHQLIFAKHDYANEFSAPDSGFNGSEWASRNGNNWDFSKHLVWETEFGNYNGSAGTVHLPWSQGAATWMAAKVNDGTLVGATAFIFKWVDANSITPQSNQGGLNDFTGTTTWGGYVKNNFLPAVTNP